MYCIFMILSISWNFFDRKLHSKLSFFSSLVAGWVWVSQWDFEFALTQLVSASIHAPSNMFCNWFQIILMNFPCFFKQLYFSLSPHFMVSLCTKSAFFLFFYVSFFQIWLKHQFCAGSSLNRNFFWTLFTSNNRLILIIFLTLLDVHFVEFLLLFQTKRFLKDYYEGCLSLTKNLMLSKEGSYNFRYKLSHFIPLIFIVFSCWI